MTAFAITAMEIINALFIYHSPGLMKIVPSLAAVYLAAGTFGSLAMPFVYRLGVEKGRYVFMVMGGIMGLIMSVLISINDALAVSGGFKLSVGVAAIILMVAAVLFALSWVISIEVFKRREL